MAVETTRTNTELDALRIPRTKEQPRRKRTPLVSAASICVVIAVLASFGYTLYTRTLGHPPTVQTIMVTARTDSQSSVLLTGSGYIVTRHKYITIGTKILGQIVDEPIEEGQHVKVGDVLARIDDRDYQAQLRQAIAIRDLAKANLRLAQSKADRASRLKDARTISTDDFETAMNAAEGAQAELQRDEAAVDYARFNVNQCVIDSPINGIVLKKYRELGDTINFGGEIQAGGGATDIVQLADTDDMRAEVDINEIDIAKVGLGSPATVVLDSYTDRQFEATLVKIYPEADRQKGTVKIEVQIEKPDLQIVKPEMSAKVSFLLNKSATINEPRLIVPKSAVRSEGSEAYVWAVLAGVAHRMSILRGRETEIGVEVKHGVKDGDIIIITSEAALKEGQPVTATEQSSPPTEKPQTVRTN
jgi:RND family efflux transporter MFP subunit